MFKPTTTTLTAYQQFNSLAPRAPFFIDGVEYFRSARRVFNTETMVTVGFTGYRAGGLAETHSIEFSIIFDHGSDTYTWSFSIIDEEAGTARHGELTGMYWNQFEDLAGLVAYAVEAQNA